MAENLVELAQKMAQAARAGVAIEKKRLQEILVQRQKKSAPSSKSWAAEVHGDLPTQGISTGPL